MAGTVIADNLQAASTSTLVIKNGVASTPPTIQDSAGTEIGTFCRAWVNFNGTGTVAIRASFNVSSITDNGSGYYTANLNNATPDANAAVIALNGDGTPNTDRNQWTTGRMLDNLSAYISIYNDAGVAIDSDFISVAIFR